MNAPLTRTDDALIALELHRCFALSSCWDDALYALQDRDYDAFDNHMRRFRELSKHPQGTGAAQEAARHNHGN